MHREWSLLLEKGEKERVQFFSIFVPAHFYVISWKSEDTEDSSVSSPPPEKSCRSMESSRKTVLEAISSHFFTQFHLPRNTSDANDSGLRDESAGRTFPGRRIDLMRCDNREEQKISYEARDGRAGCFSLVRLIFTTACSPWRSAKDKRRHIITRYTNFRANNSCAATRWARTRPAVFVIVIRHGNGRA